MENLSDSDSSGIEFGVDFAVLLYIAGSTGVVFDRKQLMQFGRKDRALLGQ